MTLAPALRYPLAVSGIAFGVCVVVAVVASSADQVSAAVTVAVIILGYSSFRLTRRPVTVPAGSRRVRHQHRLSSRSWIEQDGVWLPVFFEPAAVLLPSPTASPIVVYPSGPQRNSEPRGRLLDSPTRPAPDADKRAHAASRWLRRLTLDGQYAIAGPFVGLFWVYTFGGGTTAFAGATAVAAVTAIWFAAIRGSDPS